MICGAALQALAPSSASAQAADQEVTEIVDTGPRIAQPNLESVSPVLVIGADEIRTGGRTSTTDIVNQLPQVSPAAAGGAAAVDLRGLGPQRTLVLVDGRRLGAADPRTGNPNAAPDINQIPWQLIERAEVLTGGASATYGSDAVAGVVNFIMKRDFEGVQLDALWGVSQHSQHNEVMQRLLAARQITPPKDSWDGASRDLSLILGANLGDDRGNVTGYLTYHDQQPVVQNRRDYAACQLSSSRVGAACAGSADSNQWLFSGGARFNLPGAPAAIAVSGDAFQPWTGDAVTPPAPLFNTQDYADLIHQSTRYSGGYYADYAINRHVHLYSDFGFMRDRAKARIAPSGLFQGRGPTASGGFLVNCDNPFLSAQQQTVLNCSAAEVASGAPRDLLVGRRNIEAGGRVQSEEHTSYRIVAGLRGDILGAWKYDLGASYSYTRLVQLASNDVSVTRAQDALLVRNNAGGQPACISGAGCVPYDIFKEGGVTPAALAFLDVSASGRGSAAERIVEGLITGDLGDYGVKSPYADDAVAVAIGFHHRRDHLDDSPDAALLSGDLSGAGAAYTAIDNSLRVAEGFVEARIPIAQDIPYLREVSVDLAYRYSKYSTGAEAKTWMIAGRWTPIEGYRIRGAVQRAVRAPTIAELYRQNAVTGAAAVGDDPCAAGSRAPATLEQCLRTGITPAQFGVTPNCPPGQCAQLFGGNTSLRPEDADILTVGLTAQPGLLTGVTASIDYYSIRTSDRIGAFPGAVTLNRCLQGRTLSCSGVVRGAQGSLFGGTAGAGGYIDGRLQNIAETRNEGVDLQLTYQLPMNDWGLSGWGVVSLSMAGSYVLSAATRPLPGEPAYECVSLFGLTCGGMFPKWRHSLRIDWQTPWVERLSVAATWRYIGEARNQADTNEPTIGGGADDASSHLLPERSYVDLAARWRLNDRFEVRGGVNNVLDQDPPLIDNLISGIGSPNSYTGYDVLGRRLFVGLTASF